jgi:hypothetical protein
MKCIGLFFILRKRQKMKKDEKINIIKETKTKKREKITSWFVDSLVFQAPSCIGQEGGSTKLTKEIRPTLT